MSFQKEPLSSGETAKQEARSSPQKRAIFFVFDGGTGIGHLRRLSCIAKQLQGEFACLIVTGHRAAANWFVPPECEYIHVPAWDSLLTEKAAYWGRKPFLDQGPEAALQFRRELMQAIVDSFKPDVIVVDHLPLGMRGELEAIIENTPCRKYLITRAVQNETEDLDQLLLAGKARESIRRFYDRVFVAIDNRVFDLKERYRELDEVAHKFCLVGYVIEPVSLDAIARKREERGLADDDIWVVASAGGGQYGEALIENSCHLVSLFPEISFDIVLGPRSNLSLDDTVRQVSGARNLRLHDEVSDLAKMHAAADIVISSGGYNTLLEALQGNAHILCVPSRKSKRDEQYVHADRLRQFASIDLDTDANHVQAMLERAVASIRAQTEKDARSELDFTGATNIKRVISNDLGLRRADPDSAC